MKRSILKFGVLLSIFVVSCSNDDKLSLSERLVTYDWTIHNIQKVEDVAEVSSFDQFFEENKEGMTFYNAFINIPYKTVQFTSDSIRFIRQKTQQEIWLGGAVDVTEAGTYQLSDNILSISSDLEEFVMEEYNVPAGVLEFEVIYEDDYIHLGAIAQDTASGQWNWYMYHLFKLED